MTHIILWLWDGWRPIYAREHVNALVRMLQTYLSLQTRSYRIICMTDKDDRFACESRLLPKEPMFAAHSKPNCYRRLQMFDPAMQNLLSISPGDWIVSMDLDTVITGNLWPLISWQPDASFVATAGNHSKYNGALWRLTAGTHADVWSDFNYQTTPLWLKKQRLRGGAQIGSDQAWLSHKIKDAPMWNTTHGLCFYMRHCKQVPYSDAVLWNFAGNVKPWSSSVKITAPALYKQYQRFM